MILEFVEKYQKVLERMEVNNGALRYALFEKGGRRVEFGPPHSYDWNRVKYFMDYF